MKFRLNGTQFCKTVQALSLCLLASSAYAHDYGDDRLWARHPLSLHEQREEIHNLLASVILSDDLDAIALVYSHSETMTYFSAMGIGRANVMRYSFDYYPAFVAKSLYSKSKLPETVFVIMPGYRLSTHYPQPGRRPGNYRSAMFKGHGEFNLVFLKNDHILNRKPNIHYTDTVSLDNGMEFSDVVKQPELYDDVLRSLRLEVLSEDNRMFSLLERYSSFLIEAPPDYDWEGNFPGKRAQNDQATRETYMLPAAFLLDLQVMLERLSLHKTDTFDAMDAFQTEDGRAIWEIVLSKLSNGKEFPLRQPAHVRFDRHPPVFADFFKSVSGVVKNEAGNSVSGAEIEIWRIMHPSPAGKISSSEADGAFAVDVDVSFVDGGFLYARKKGYAPSFYALPTEHDQLRNLEVVLRKGFTVDLLSTIQASDVADKLPSSLRENAGEHPSTGAAFLLHADSGVPAYFLLSPAFRDDGDEWEEAVVGFWGERILLNSGKYILITYDDEIGIQSLLPLCEVEITASGLPAVRRVESELPQKYKRILQAILGLGQWGDIRAEVG